MNIRAITKKLPPLERVRRYLRPLRGLGYAGDGHQRLRSDQARMLSELTGNQQFIRQFPELLTCNERRLNIAVTVDVAAEIERYFKAGKTERHYPDPIVGFPLWIDKNGHDWGNLHAAHQAVVDACIRYKPKTVCDIGAGSGVVSKYVFAATKGASAITAVESSLEHIETMRRNFSKESTELAPQMNVPAAIIKGFIQNIPLPDKSQELVFTCTVMMHQPFVAGVLAACEMARISSRYILHVEGYHTAGIVRGFREPHNLLVPDYERLYRLLGFSAIRKDFYRDPHSPDYDYVVFLAERNESS